MATAKVIVSRNSTKGILKFSGLTEEQELKIKKAGVKIRIYEVSNKQCLAQGTYDSVEIAVPSENVLHKMGELMCFNLLVVFLVAECTFELDEKEANSSSGQNTK